MDRKISLVDMTPDQAAEALAKRAADLRTRPRTYAEKSANGIADVLTSVGSQIKDSPHFRNTLLGAGLGAGVGGLSTAIGNSGKEEKDRRSMGQAMLTGGLAGGALGGGASLAHGMLTGGKGDGPDAGPQAPGVFTDPATGQKRQIDPQALKDNPGLASRVRELTNPKIDPVSKGLGAALGTAWNSVRRAVPGLQYVTPESEDGADVGKHAPISASVLPAVGAADFALHNDKLRLGDRAGMGMIEPGNSRIPEHMRRGVQETLKGKLGGKDGGGYTPEGFDAHQMETLRGINSDKSEMADLVKNRRAFGRLPDTDGSQFVGPPNPVGGINQTEAANLARGGAAARFAEHGKNKALGDAVNSTPRVYRGLFGDKELLGGWRAGARGAGRVMAYGLPVAAEWSMRNYLQDRSRDGELQRLMKAHSREVQ